MRWFVGPAAATGGGQTRGVWGGGRRGTGEATERHSGVMCWLKKKH